MRDAQAAPRAGGSEETRRQLEDASYTLCMVTGTRQLDTACTWPASS
ncbi:DUF5133 domain-containing protein [Streptomyces swartbergensis]|uniref:DUF5133 domain-containing protein n=1 Tax=Streptomyces swartbergensis TaxID=487165 RepID=A0A243QJ33_9ACTN|nr:hypothetical protein CA983_42810 [Streptomyces swartbergensis]